MHYPRRLPPILNLFRHPKRSYIIGNRDLLAVFVYQIPGLNRQVRVSQGVIRLPFVPKPIRAAGYTAPQLARQVAQVLMTNRLARNPFVQVVVRQVRSRPIVVTGDVVKPVRLEGRPVKVNEAALEAVRHLLASGLAYDPLPAALLSDQVEIVRGH